MTFTRTYLALSIAWITFLLLAYPVSYAQTAGPGLKTAARPADLVSLPEATAANENFEDPKLSPGALKQTVALLTERAEFPTYTRELWHMQWRQGDPIDLYIILPKGVPTPPAILYLYSFPADTERFLSDTYCKTVTSRGVGAVGFVSALTGQRYHDRPWKEWFISDLPEALGASAHDVQMIINFLETRPNLDAHRLGMFGQGSGASIAVLAAAVDPRIRAIDLLDPWGDWKDWLKDSVVVPNQDRPELLSPAFLASVSHLEPLTRLPDFEPMRIRLQQTSFDPNTPASVRTLLAGRMPQGAEMIRYESIDDYVARASTDGRILSWLSNLLVKLKT